MSFSLGNSRRGVKHDAVCTGLFCRFRRPSRDHHAGGHGPDRGQQYSNIGVLLPIVFCLSAVFIGVKIVPKLLSRFTRF